MDDYFAVCATPEELRRLGLKRKRELRRSRRVRARVQGAAAQAQLSTEVSATGVEHAEIPVARSPHRTIHVASDCAGVGTDILALESITCLAGCVVHEFASEKDPGTRRVLAHNSPHVKHVSAGCAALEHTYGDSIDLYFNLSSCRTVSSLTGEQDKPARLIAKKSVVSSTGQHSETIPTTMPGS